MRLSSLVAVMLVALVVLAGVASAETRTGDTVVVERGETVDGDLSAFAGTVIVQGTVDGDLSAFAGTVVVAGTVTGNVEGAAGSVRISGDVGGNVQAAAGDISVGESATVGGSLEVGAGSVVVDGTVNGDVRVGAERFVLGDTARVGGDVVYDAETFEDRGAAVDGAIRQDENLVTGGPLGDFPRFSPPGWVVSAYLMTVNLLLGAVLLAVFPGFSRRVADRVATRPLATGGVGLLTLVGVPLVLALVALTIVGIPLSLLGAFLFAVFVWAAVVYGAYAVGAWLASLAGVTSRWVALAVGVVGVELVGYVPWLGGLIQFVVFLLGLGALALGVYALLGRPGRPVEEVDGEPGESGEPGPA